MYVNLIASSFAILVYYFSYVKDLDISTTRKGPNYLFDLTLILRVFNEFRAN